MIFKVFIISLIACWPLGDQPCQLGQDGSMEGTTTANGTLSWFCFPPGATEGQGIGDGICNGWANTAECGYDGGDCNGHDFSSCSPPIHILTLWIGDGICDLDLDNPECGNDGGDCDSTFYDCNVYVIYVQFYAYRNTRNSFVRRFAKMLG